VTFGGGDVELLARALSRPRPQQPDFQHPGPGHVTPKTAGPDRPRQQARQQAPGPSQRPDPSKSTRVDWPVRPRGQMRPEARLPNAPLQVPGTAGSLDGEVKTNKSSQGRADAQRLVATRLLDRLHDPLGHFSRLQRIYPRAR
jgi:hypothetical protein